VLLKYSAPKLLTSALILQGSHWPCALYALRSLLLPCGPGPDTEAASKPTAKWLEAVAAAKCIPEVVEAVRRNADRLGVVEPAVRLLLRLCVGKDSDTDRRRAFAVDADAAPILLEVTDALGDAVTNCAFLFLFFPGRSRKGEEVGGRGRCL
jgi:hypothetical protein